jgi:hypothetical protein
MFLGLLLAFIEVVEVAQAIVFVMQHIDGSDRAVIDHALRHTVLAGLHPHVTNSRPFHAVALQSNFAGRPRSVDTWPSRTVMHFRQSRQR